MLGDKFPQATPSLVVAIKDGPCHCAILLRVKRDHVLSLDRFEAVSLPGHANNSKRLPVVYCGQLLRAQIQRAPIILELLSIATLAARIKKNSPGAASQSPAGRTRGGTRALDVFACGIIF